MDQVLFTIAIPTHNNFNTIKNCVQSAINQETQSAYEIVVSDTSSDDNTEAFFSSLESKKIRYFRNECSWTMWDNHNFLLKEARGRYIVFIHADDVLLSDALDVFDRYTSSLGYPNRIIMSGESIYHSFRVNLRSLGLREECIIAGGDAISLFSFAGLTPSGTLFSKDICETGGFIANSLILPYSDLWAELYCSIKGYRYLFFPNIVFLRSSNGTTLIEGTKEDVKLVYDRLMKIFDRSECDIIIESALRQRSVYVLRHFLCDKQYSKRIKKRIVLKVIKHPIKSRHLVRLLFE